MAPFGERRPSQVMMDEMRAELAICPGCAPSR